MLHDGRCRIPLLRAHRARDLGLGIPRAAFCSTSLRSLISSAHARRGVRRRLLRLLHRPQRRLSVCSCRPLVTPQLKSRHGACTVVFVAVGAIIVFLFASIQTLSRISWLGWVGVCSIFVSVVTLAIAVGVSDRPAAAPLTGPLDKDIRAFREVPFVDAMNAINVSVSFFLEGEADE